MGRCFTQEKKIEGKICLKNEFTASATKCFLNVCTPLLKKIMNFIIWNCNCYQGSRIFIWIVAFQMLCTYFHLLCFSCLQLDSYFGCTHAYTQTHTHIYDINICIRQWCLLGLGHNAQIRTCGGGIVLTNSITIEINLESTFQISQQQKPNLVHVLFTCKVVK